VTDNGSDNNHKNLVKQHYLESMKGSGAMSNKKGFNIKFTNDGNMCSYLVSEIFIGLCDVVLIGTHFKVFIFGHWNSMREY
jgi:hypothetical protein